MSPTHTMAVVPMQSNLQLCEIQCSLAVLRSKFGLHGTSTNELPLTSYRTTKMAYPPDKRLQLSTTLSRAGGEKWIHTHTHTQNSTYRAKSELVDDLVLVGVALSSLRDFTNLYKLVPWLELWSSSLDTLSVRGQVLLVRSAKLQPESKDILTLRFDLEFSDTSIW